MTMEEICEILSQHRKSIGKRDLLQIEIAEAEETLKIMQRTVAEDVAARKPDRTVGLDVGIRRCAAAHRAAKNGYRGIETRTA